MSTTSISNLIDFLLTILLKKRGNKNKKQSLKTDKRWIVYLEYTLAMR